MQANLAVVTKPSSFPSGTVGGGWVFYIRDNKGGDPRKVVSENPSATFDVVENTTYIAGVQRLDVNEVPLGALVETQFNTNANTVTIETAGSLTVSVTG